MNFVAVTNPFPTMRAWRAVAHNFSFVITQELETGAGFENFTGFTASWKNMESGMQAFGQQPANRIDGGPWNSFVDAENACKNTLKNLRTQQ